MTDEEVRTFHTRATERAKARGRKAPFEAFAFDRLSERYAALGLDINDWAFCPERAKP